MEQLQIAVRQFDAKDYPKKSEDLDIPDLLDTEDAKESDACSLKTLFAFAIGKTRMRCVGSCQLEFFCRGWMRSGWGPTMNSTQSQFLKRKSLGFHCALTFHRLTNAFQGVVHEPPVSSNCNPHR